MAKVDRHTPKHLVRFYLQNFNVLFPVTLSSIYPGHNQKKIVIRRKKYEKNYVLTYQIIATVGFILFWIRVFTVLS